MMSKKDYEIIAKVLHKYALSGTAYINRDTARSIAQDLAGHFASENPRFDTLKFLKTAGVIL